MKNEELHIDKFQFSVWRVEAFPEIDGKLPLAMQDEDNYPESTTRIPPPSLPHVESAGSWRFDVRRSWVLRTLAAQTHRRVRVMCPWFVWRGPACGIPSRTEASCNRLRWLAWLADAGEHHCSLCGCLNWFSPGIHRQSSLSLFQAGYLKSEPLNYGPIVSIC